MGLSKLNIYVSAIDDPCKVDRRTWYVTIYNCDGSVLEYCGRRYVVIPARCGHVELDVPPGCYYIKAVWSYVVVKPGLIYRANHFTDAAIVTLCCDAHQCVRLFNPSVHRCGFIYALAVKDLARQEGVAAELADRVGKDVQRIRKADQGEEPVERFELGHLDEIERLLEERGKEFEGDEGKAEPFRPH